MAAGVDRPEPDDPGGAFEWAAVDESGGRAPDPGRARKVRLLVAGCVLGGVVILLLGVVGTRVVVDELDRPSVHQRLVSAIHDRYRARFDDCTARGTNTAVCATRAEQACADDPRWTLSDVTEAHDVCTFGPGD